MFGLEYKELLDVISFWGYPLMLLLMILEGPIATMTAAFLASLDIFHWVPVLLLSILGDMLGDIILYLIGFLGGRKTLEGAERMLNVKPAVIKKLEQGFEKHGARIVFSVKTTTGLSWVTFILAGTVKMPFRKFLLYSFLGGIIWSGVLVGFGYFFGYAAEQIDKYIKFAGWGIFATAVFVLLYITLLRKKKARAFLRNNKNKRKTKRS